MVLRLCPAQAVFGCWGGENQASHLRRHRQITGASWISFLPAKLWCPVGLNGLISWSVLFKLSSIETHGFTSSNNAA